MTTKDLLLDYLDKKIDAIQAIRTLTAIISPGHAVTILAIVNSITRVEQGDMDAETFKSVFKLNEASK